MRAVQSSGAMRLGSGCAIDQSAPAPSRFPIIVAGTSTAFAFKVGTLTTAYLPPRHRLVWMFLFPFRRARPFDEPAPHPDGCSSTRYVTHRRAGKRRVCARAL